MQSKWNKNTILNTLLYSTYFFPSVFPTLIMHLHVELPPKIIVNPPKNTNTISLAGFGSQTQGQKGNSQMRNALNHKGTKNKT